mgnify:CR=1 FL=1
MTPYTEHRLLLVIGLACWLTLAYVAGWISHILWRQAAPVVERVVGACGEMSGEEKGTY